MHLDCKFAASCNYGGGYSRIAVEIFFILSGFWVSKSILLSSSLKKYFIKRVKKIFPLYLLTVFFFSAVIFFFTDLSFSQYFLSKEFFKYIIFNSLTANFLCPSLPDAFNGNPVNGSLWTIKVEIGFYIILPFILWLMKKICCKNEEKKVFRCNVFLAVLYVVSTVIMCLIPVAVKRLGLHHSFSNQLPSFLSYFIAGMMCFFCYDFVFKNQNKLIIPALIVFILRRFIYIDFLLPLAIAVIVFWCAFHLTPFNNFGRQTDYSYAMYLVHFPVIQMILTTNMFSTTPVLGLAAVIGISFTLAYMMENFVQKKIR